MRSIVLLAPLATLAACGGPADRVRARELPEEPASRPPAAPTVGALPMEPGPDARAPAAEPETMALSVPGSELSIELVRVPAGAVGGREVGAFWMARTETTWDAYDAFLYGPPDESADAVSRPSPPYVDMDRGFGHEGHPAISMTHRGAAAFCDWLARANGRAVRLPTADEFRHACEPAELAEGPTAWLAETSGERTHPVASLPPNGRGLFDLLGNAAEWCIGRGGLPAVAGGSYLDAASEVDCASVRAPSSDWNRSDPQIPKSTWWYADAGFVGFRVVCPEESP